MAPKDADRRRRSASMSMAFRLHTRLPFVELFAPTLPAKPARRRRSSGDQDRDRDLERDLGRGRDRARSQDMPRDKDRKHHHNHHRKHSDQQHAHARDRNSARVEEPRHRRRTQAQLRAQQQPARERPAGEVFVRAADHGYDDIHVEVKGAMVTVAMLESAIRDRYRRRRKPIPDNAWFRFYLQGKLLEHHEEVPWRTAVVWYRVSRLADGAEGWKITHWSGGRKGLDPVLSDQMAKAIDSGATVAALRHLVAGFMGIHDANRVVLTAKDGTRRGLLQGNCWEVRQIHQWWLCRWLAVDVNPERSYVVLKGLGREYVYHPTPEQRAEGMLLREIQEYAGKRIFRNAHQYGSSAFDLPWLNISLSRDGVGVGSFTPVEWGATYTFMVPDVDADTFAVEESWLLAPTETCAVCIEDKRITDMPIRVTAGCKHKSATCRDCSKQWIESSFETTSFDRLKCPDCPERLQHADVRRLASKAVFERYDTLATRSAANEIPNFRWCLAAGCESGQIDDEGCPKFKCQACGARHCTRHNVPWHKGETCDEYERRNRKRKKEDKASELVIKKTSKKCPSCNKDVHKYDGCNHITCVCGHEWCYICFAPYQPVQPSGILICRHQPTCTEREAAWVHEALGGGLGVGRAFPAVRPPGVFVPPHLRRQNATAGAARAQPPRVAMPPGWRVGGFPPPAAPHLRPHPLGARPRPVAAGARAFATPAPAMPLQQL